MRLYIKFLISCLIVVVYSTDCNSQNVYKYSLFRYPKQLDTTILERKFDNVLFERLYQSDDMFCKIDYSYFRDSSLQLKIYYNDYVLDFIRCNNTVRDIAKASNFTAVGRSKILGDSLEYITIENVCVVIDAKTKQLLEYSRFRSPSDTIDFNSFNIESFNRAMSYDFLMPNQWFKDGTIKSFLMKRSNQYLYFRYSNCGKLCGLQIYKMITNEFDEEDCILIKDIVF